MADGGRGKAEAESNRSSRGGPVLIGALAVDSLGNGLFLPLSLVYFAAAAPRIRLLSVKSIAGVLLERRLPAAALRDPAPSAT